MVIRNHRRNRYCRNSRTRKSASVRLLSQHHGSTERTVMRNIANQTTVGTMKQRIRVPCPGIYIKETRVVTRATHFRTSRWLVTTCLHADRNGGRYAENFPPIKGFVLTTPKQTAEVALLSPIPKENAVNPILAHWQYGIGRRGRVHQRFG